MSQNDSSQDSETDENAPTIKTRRLSNRLKSHSSENSAPAPVQEGANKGPADKKGRSSLSAMDIDDEDERRRSSLLKNAEEALKKKNAEPAGAKKRRRSSRTSGASDCVDTLPVPPQSSSSTSTSTSNEVIQTQATANKSDVVSLPAPPAAETTVYRHRSNSKDITESTSNDKENVHPAVSGSQENAKANAKPVADQENVVIAPPAPVEANTSTTSFASSKSITTETNGESSSNRPPHRIVRPRYMALRMKSSDPAECLDRIDDMYTLYYEKEEQYAAKPYMHRQDDINRKMRAILVDWMVEVHCRFRLQTTTLWLAVNILDRYLMKARVMRAKLQLVGITAILISCKYEEMQPPEVTDCVTITDEAYQKVEILEMEKDILTVLDYDIMVPTAYTFLSRYLNAVQAPESTRFLAHYYAERNLQEIDSLLQPPHHVAAAALYLAHLQQQQNLCFFPGVHINQWNQSLVIESGLEPRDFIGYARIMIKHVSEETETASKRRLIACKKKFASDRYGSVSRLRLPQL